MKEKLQGARETIEEAIERHRPKHIFTLYSGGHDSACSTHFAASVLGDRLTGVVHVNTGIGIPQTREHVRQVCKQFGWPLLEYKATENTKADGTPAPVIYEDLVVEQGFPGAHHHRKMYNRLKERQLERLCREYGITSKAPGLFVTGCRSQESTRRMGNVKRIDDQGRMVWAAPFREMDALECSEYMKENGLPRNPVKDLIHMSGECLCGAFAHKGELAEIELWFPETAAEIKRIQQRVYEAGFPWGWEEQPPKWWLDKRQADKKGQEDAFEEEWMDELDSIREMLCTACHKIDELQEDLRHYDD